MRTTVLKKLITYIRRRQLTNCIELLESLGYEGEIALFVLAYVQTTLGLGGAS